MAITRCTVQSVLNVNRWSDVVFLRSLTMALRKRFAVPRQSITAGAAQRQAMPVPDTDPYRPRCISTSTPRRQVAGQKMRAFCAAVRQRCAVIGRSLSSPERSPAQGPNFSPLMLRLHIQRRTVRAKRPMDETAAAEREGHFNICALLHIVSPQQAEKT